MEYDELRYYLFSKSYIAQEIVNFLRDRYKIPPHKDYADWLKWFSTKHIDLFEEIRRRIEIETGKKSEINFDLVWVFADEVERKVFPEIKIIAKKLEIDEKLFSIFVLFNNVPKKLSGRKKIYYTNALSPIREEGVYIRIDEKLSLKELRKLHKDALFYLKVIKGDQWNNDSDKILPPFRSRKDVTEDDLNFKIGIFIKVEERIKLITQEKKNVRSRKSIREKDDYQNYLVEGAMERLAGDYLAERENINDSDDEFDRQLEVRKRRIKTFYYEIARRYRLPTPKKLNSILRLISI